MATTRRLFRLFALAWTPDGSCLAVGGTGTSVRILDAATLATRQVSRGHAAGVRSLAWSPDGRSLAWASGDGMVQVWRADDGTLAARLPLRQAHAVAWSPRGDLLAASSWHGRTGGTVELWETAHWAPVGTIPDGAASLAWSPDGRHLAAGGTSTVTIVAAASGAIERQLACRALKYALGLSWAPDGARLAVGGNNPNAVEVWDAAHGDIPLVTYRGHRSYIWCVDWSPDGHWVASGGWGQVHVWDPATGTLLAMYHGHVGDVYALAWSPDGSQIASGGRDRTVQVWRPSVDVTPDLDTNAGTRL